MKTALCCCIVALTVMVVSAGLTCMTDKEKCGENECCIKIGPVGHCKAMLEEDKVCEMKPAKHLLKDWVYLHACPCTAGLACKSSKGGIVGKFMGKCHESSDEVTEEPEREE